MCITIFAKKRTISIEYASESVWLNKDGLMEIVTDLLITNKSETHIDELFCILPQKMFYPVGYKLPRKYKDQNLYEDITEDIVDENSKYNHPSIDKSFRKIIDQETLQTIVELDLSNPDKASEDWPYRGYYYGGNSMSHCQDLDDLCHAILTKLKLSIFVVQLDKPLIKEKARWFRWRFLALTGPLELRNKSNYFIDRFTNNLFYNYSVNGPGKVLESIIPLLQSFRKSADIYSKEFQINTGKIINAFDKIYDYLVVDGISHDSTKVSFNDWRTRFYKRKLEPFTSIQTEGDVQAVGSQPNILFDYKDLYYEWKTGKMNSLSKTDSAYFTIRFLTQYVPTFHKMLPLISFLIALASLAISIFLWF